MIYVDTSVIVAALDPRDTRHKVARETLERFDDKIVSELVLAELASVLTRKPHIVKNVAKRLRLSKEEAVVTILIYVLNRFGIKYRSVDGAVRLPILGNVYVPVALAIELSSRARLKTLEQLHLAYAKAMKERRRANRRDTHRGRWLREGQGVAKGVWD